MSAPVPTLDSTDPVAVLIELGLPPTATYRDVRRAAAQRVVLGLLAKLVERLDLEVFQYLEMPPEGWSFDGPAPSSDEVDQAIEEAAFRGGADATGAEFGAAAQFELWQLTPKLARAVGLIAEAHRRDVKVAHAKAMLAEEGRA